MIIPTTLLKVINSLSLSQTKKSRSKLIVKFSADVLSMLITPLRSLNLIIRSQFVLSFWYIILMACARHHHVLSSQDLISPSTNSSTLKNSIKIRQGNETNLNLGKSTPPSQINPHQNTATQQSNSSCLLKFVETKNVRSVYEYDLWLVNGYPQESPFGLINLDHQFSYEQQVCPTMPSALNMSQ